MRKVKTMSTKPEVTDDDLHRYQNFDGVLAMKKAADARQLAVQRLWRGGSAVGVIAVVFIAVWLLQPREPEENRPSNGQQSSWRKWRLCLTLLLRLTSLTKKRNRCKATLTCMNTSQGS